MHLKSYVFISSAMSCMVDVDLRIGVVCEKINVIVGGKMLMNYMLYIQYMVTV